MTAETFFEKFELFADAPNAVEKMRELVLSLAVAGQLVPQDANDEPVAVLLKVAPDRLPAEKRKRFPPPLAPVEDPPGPTPAGWQWTRFQDVAFIASNLVDPAAHLDLPHLAPDNIEKRNGVLLHCRTVREDKVKSGKHRFYAGQLVYSKIRPNLSKVALVEFDGLCSADMYPIDALIEPRYLLWYMLSGVFLKQAVKSDTRVAMPKINQEELNAIAVPVPPLAEQKRIVAKVDELMALCDRLEAQQNEREGKHAALARAALARFADAPTPANLGYLFHPSYAIDPADLRRSILTQAVHGKLVPQSASDESAAVMLERLDSLKEDLVKAGKAKQWKQFQPVEAGNEPYSIPSTWAWTRVERMCEAVVDCPHSTPVFVSQGVTCLDTNSFKQGRLIPHRLRFVSEGTFEARVQRLTPKEGDIVFAREGSVGESVIVPDGMRCCLGQRVMLFRLLPGLLPEYVRMALSESASLDRLFALHKGIGAKHVNVADMRNALLPLPPLDEQRRIVAKVDQLMALIDRLEAQLTESRATAERLMEAAVVELTAPGRVWTVPPNRGEAYSAARVPPESAGEPVGFPATLFADLAPIDAAPETGAGGGIVARRARVAAYLLHELKADPSFQRTKLEKLNHLIEYHCGFDLGREPVRDEHGPNDYAALRGAEDYAADPARGWFTVHAAADGYGVEYRPGPRLAEAAAAQRRAFGDKLAAVEALVGWLRKGTKEECEVIATLYAAWNDLLLAGASPDDAAIIRDVRDHWHPAKRKIAHAKWQAGLNRMRGHGLVPRGTGRPVLPKPGRGDRGIP